MKKKDLKKLALLGIAGGLIAASQGNVQADQNNTNNDLLASLIDAKCGKNGCNKYAPNPRNRDGYIAEADETTTDQDTEEDTNNNYKDADSTQLMTEDQLMSQLNDQGKQMYKNLDSEGKAVAIKLASRTCKGTNDCKGQGACKTEKNACAGKNSCVDMSKCNFKDKNLAVKVAAQLQAEKRSKSNRGSY